MSRVLSDIDAAKMLMHYLYRKDESISLSGFRTERFEFLTDPDFDPEPIYREYEIFRYAMDWPSVIFGSRAIGKTRFCIIACKCFPQLLMFQPEVMVFRHERYGEIKGIHYIDWDEQTFYQALRRNEFLVAYRSGSKLAGILKAQLAAAFEADRKVLLIANLPGYCALSRLFPSMRAIMLTASLEDYALYRKLRNLPPLPYGTLQDPDMGPYGPFSFNQEVTIPGMMYIKNVRYTWRHLLEQPHFSVVEVVKQGAHNREIVQLSNRSQDALLHYRRIPLYLELQRIRNKSLVSSNQLDP